MTLPTEAETCGEEGASQEVRPTARVVRRQQSHILREIRWGSALEESLVQAGFLDGQALQEITTGEKAKAVLDLIVERRSLEGLKQLLNILENTDNQSLAQTIWEDYQQESHQGSARAITPEQEREMVRLKRRLQETEKAAKHWQQRVQELEAKQVNLEATLQGEGGKKNVTNKDGATEGDLSPRGNEQQDRLYIDLKEKHKGLPLWRVKEQQCKSEINQLKEKIDELSGTIKSKDEEIENYKMKEHRQKEKLDVCATPSESGSRGRKRGVTLPNALPPLKDNKLRTFPGAGAQKLPSIDATVVKYDIIEPINKLDSKPYKHCPLPAIDGAKRESCSNISGLMLSPRSNLIPSILSIPTEDDGTLSCIMNEKWIDRQGGQVELPNVTLHVPPNSVSQPVLISVTETNYHHTRQRQFAEAGLDQHLEAGMQLRLQPHGIHFLRPVYLEMKDVHVDSSSQLMVFHKDVEPHCDTPWTDITAEASPKVRKQDVIIGIDRFSIVETIKILAPMVTLAAGMALGYKMHASALFNNKFSACNMYVYHRPQDPYLVVMCNGQGDECNNNGNFTSLDSEYKFVGCASTRYPLCDQENLYFYYNNGPNLVGAFPFEFDKSNAKGQRFHVPLPSSKGSGLPKALVIRRRINSHISEEDLCEIKLGEGKPPHAPREEKWQEVLRKSRVDIVKSLDVENVIDHLEQENVVNIGEREHLLTLTSSRSRAGKLLDIISKKGQDAFKVFIVSLQHDYPFLVKQLNEKMKPPKTKKLTVRKLSLDSLPQLLKAPDLSKGLPQISPRSTNNHILQPKVIPATGPGLDYPDIGT